MSSVTRPSERGGEREGREQHQGSSGLSLSASSSEHLARGSGPHGRIEVSQHAIATIAGRAVAECYGVVGIAARHPRLGTVELLPPEHYSRGVQVRFATEELIIELFVVLEFGLRVSEIAHNIMGNVAFAVERTLGVRVKQVNVNVQALRISREK